MDDKTSKTVAEQINVMKAAQAGAPIVVKAYDSRKWTSVENPAFNWGTSDYKVTLDYTELFNSAVSSIDYTTLYNTLYYLERGKNLGNAVDYSVDILQESKTKIANNVKQKFDNEYQSIGSDITPDSIKDTGVYSVVYNSLKSKYFKQATEEANADSTILEEYNTIEDYFNAKYTDTIKQEMETLVSELNITIKKLTNESAINALVDISDDTIDGIILEQKNIDESALYDNNADSVDTLKSRMSTVMNEAVEKYNSSEDDTYSVAYDDDIRVTIKKQTEEPEPAISINYSLFNYSLNGEENPQMDWDYNDEGKVVTVTGITATEAQDLVDNSYTNFLNKLKEEEEARKQSDDELLGYYKSEIEKLYSDHKVFVTNVDDKLSAMAVKHSSDIAALKENGMFTNLYVTNPIQASLIGSSVKTDTLTVNKTSTLTGAVTMANTLDVTGKITAQNNLSVTGNISSNGSITADGNISTNSNLSAVGNISGKNITATGTLDVTSNTTLGGTLEVKNTLTADKGISTTDISADTYFKSLEVPYITEGTSYVFLLGNILPVGSTDVNSPYNWDISGAITFKRPSGHCIGRVRFSAGHGYSHDWKTYISLEKMEARGVGFTPVTCTYKDLTWLAIKVTTACGGYSAGIQIDYKSGTFNTTNGALTMVPYYGAYQNVNYNISEITESITVVSDDWIIPFKTEKANITELDTYDSDGSVYTVGDALKSLSESVSTIGASLSDTGAIGSAVATNTSDIAGLKTTTESNSKNIDNLTTTVSENYSTLSKNISDNTENITNLTTTVSENYSTLSGDISNNTKNIEGLADTVLSNYNTLSENISSNSTKIAALEDSVSSLTFTLSGNTLTITQI